MAQDVGLDAAEKLPKGPVVALSGRTGELFGRIVKRHTGASIDRPRLASP
ncbi:hypothetical protein Skr01_52520 [Sphaerisporangium krabiense]|nr:hypothetical protein Skr01_52520 [Sphaerisporangium krabiense]